MAWTYQMLDWIEIWVIWSPSQQLTLIVVLIIPEPTLLCDRMHNPTERGYSH